jgi:hypothetical protein
MVLTKIKTAVRKVSHTLLALGSSCLAHVSGLRREVVLYRTGIVEQTVGLAFRSEISDLGECPCDEGAAISLMVAIQNFFLVGLGPPAGGIPMPMPR